MTTFAQEAAVKKEEKNKPALRILSVAVLPGAENIMLASKDEEGEWKILSEEVEIRSRFITQWLKAERGEIHLVKKKDEVVESLGTFIFPNNAKRLLLVIIPNIKKENYSIDIIDPGDLGFSKGKTLVANYSRQTAVAKLGSVIKEVEYGEKMVIKAKPDDNGMYRMTLGYIDKKNKPVPCYDRYVGYSEESRDFLLLFPDKRQTGFGVFSLAEFGPFE
jgi:hypothetical protein